MRIAIIERKKCTHKKCGYVCQKVCPGVRMGDETVSVGEDGYPIISEELCTGCGICVKKCPVSCIKVINLVEEKGAPIFQYGVNAFRLYGIPLPSKEGVVGLIGKNGIGKTTALKLLSGSLWPNFGDAKKKWGREEIGAKLSLEGKKYFQPLFAGKVKVAYKPQNVDKITASFKGKVRQLLEKVAERKKLAEAVEIFGLGEFLDREISKLSGGELQRVALAATWLKEAELYYFDEPTSYLDIEQRLKMGQILQALAEERRVMVVEHDLALLDYLSNYVYIFYGKENAYGIVSGIKGGRAGINEYLDGYLKDENVRFRDKGIVFDKQIGTERKGRVKQTYPALGKDFPNFKFSAEPGELKEGEIIGILGKNAIGKSLFVKMLAGVEKPDSGEAPANLKISYKPQYVTATKGVKVSQLLSAKELNPAVLEEAKARLEVGALMERELTELSGGELQRVAITYALAQKADLYLLDEPSAFLDIEQRLHFASLLRSVIENSEKCAFVVDHDIVLVDAVSSRLLVFQGESSRFGQAGKPLPKREGMNLFLKGMGITLRRDKESFRPRINKPGSTMDREQKDAEEYYYYWEGK